MFKNTIGWFTYRSKPTDRTYRFCLLQHYLVALLVLPLKSSFYVFYDENVTTLAVFVIRHVTKDCAV